MDNFYSPVDDGGPEAYLTAGNPGGNDSLDYGYGSPDQEAGPLSADISSTTIQNFRVNRESGLVPRSKNRGR